MTEPCQWPEGACKCAEQEADKPDHAGRVWMHCEQGLSLTKASMARFMVFCLENSIQVGDVFAFARYPRSSVMAAVRLQPCLFEEFERVTGGELQKPPRVKLNSA